MTDLNKVVTQLLLAATGVIAAPERDPWERGWSLEEYRRSDRAALAGAKGPVCLTPDALVAWETGAELLWRDHGVRARWSDEERWGLLGSLTVAASEQPQAQREKFLASAIQRFCTAGPAFVLQLLANVSWSGDPLRIGEVVIGAAGQPLIDLANASSSGRSVADAATWQQWLDERVHPRAEVLESVPVAACSWTTGQSDRAIIEAERQIRELIDLPLLFERDLKSHRIYRRGEVNRPGIRGLTLDRAAVERGLRDGVLSLELAAFPLVRTEVLRPGDRVHWYSADPLPLGELYEQADLFDAVERAVAETTVARRLRVGARWFAEAHYTSADDDAALALGVCLDALLGGKRALPGSAMGDRVALLTPDPSKRREARKSYMDFYGIRSSVAHGGRSSNLNADALREAFELAHGVAWRLLDLEDAFNPTSDDDLDAVFDDLRLGIIHWPQTPEA